MQYWLQSLFFHKVLNFTMFGMAKMLACLLAVPALALQSNPRRGTPPSRALRSAPHGTLGVRLPVFDASLVDDEELVATAVDAPVAAADELAGAVDDDAVALCSRMFARFARGQELLRQNHGVPVPRASVHTILLFVTRYHSSS